MKQGLHLIILESIDEMKKRMKDNELYFQKYVFAPLKYRDRNTYLIGAMQ